MALNNSARPRDGKGTTVIVGAAAVLGISPTASTLPMYLIMVSGGTPGLMIPLKPEGLRIGRASENSQQFREASVSRYHALMAPDEKGSAWLTDLGSTNGTFVNDSRLDCMVPTEIKDGDRIQFGSSIVLKFVQLDPCDEKFQREMYERTVRDALTGLYNRAYFLERIDHFAAESASRGMGLGLVLIDLDHFKKINDTYGHDAGDAVLQQVGGVLRTNTRAEDLVARYGGEEFVAALPVGNPNQAAELAERIRSSFAACKIHVGGNRLRITASAGLAFAPAGTLASGTALISAADDFLYQAKKTGRDRVVFQHERTTFDVECLASKTVAFNAAS